MKNSLLLSGLALVVGLAVTLGTLFFGTRPSVAFGCEIFVGLFAASGVLAIFARDYSRSTSAQPRRTRPAAAASPQPAQRDAGAAIAATWGYQTFSA